MHICVCDTIDDKWEYWKAMLTSVVNNKHVTNEGHSETGLTEEVRKLMCQNYLDNKFLKTRRQQSRTGKIIRA